MENERQIGQNSAIDHICVSALNKVKSMNTGYLQTVAVTWLMKSSIICITRARMVGLLSERLWKKEVMVRQDTYSYIDTQGERMLDLSEKYTSACQFVSVYQ